MFYGWRIVGVSALAQGVSGGATFYAYGAFLKPLAAEFEVSRLAVTLGLTLLMLVQGAVAPFLGWALDRGSAKRVMIAGVIVHATGMGLLSISTAFWQIGLVFATAISIGACLFGTIATATLVANWFIRRRGQALGLAAMGTAFGGAIFPILATGLIEGLGWRGAVRVIGAGLLLLIPPLWWVLVQRPEELGLRPDGDPEGVSPESAGEGAGTRGTLDLLRRRNFWAIAIGIGFTYCPVSVLLAHLVPYATDLGFSPSRASAVMSGFALASLVGRVLVGSLADAFEKRVVSWLLIAALGLSWACLLGEPPFWKLLLGAIGAGAATGGILPLWGALVGAAFGREAFGRSMGLMNFVMLPFSIVGAPIAAYLFDRTGSYQLALSTFLAAFVVGAFAIAFVRVDRA